MSQQQQYDFYFTKLERIQGSFKGKSYTEKVFKDTAPKSRAYDLLHIGTGIMTDVQEFWRG